MRGCLMVASVVLFFIACTLLALWIDWRWLTVG